MNSIENIYKWDARFLELAKHISTWSKDPSSKVGAVITDTRKRVISVGFNGFPAGTSDDSEIYENRPKKYKRVLHAERNAILFAKQNLDRYNLYVWPTPPCTQCAAEIIQAGIDRVVSVPPPKAFAERWAEDMKETRELFLEAGIMYQLLDYYIGKNI